MQKRKLVLIEWEDASSRDESWSSHETLENRSQLIAITSVGWLMGRTRDRTTIAAHLSNDSATGDMTIPTKTIKKMRVLRQPK